jgi:hypothetical protein
MCLEGKFMSLDVVNVEGETIMSMSNDCQCGCFFNCMDELKVFSPPGNLIGVVGDSCGIFRSKYQISDAMLPDSPLFDIAGPLWTCSCVCDIADFDITETGLSSIDKKKIGMICKHWGGLEKDILADFDSFGVSFPIDTESKHKALFLAACFLIVSVILQFCKVGESNEILF